MKILVLNCGSSSIKYALYDMTDKSVITSGGIEKIGLPDSFIKVKLNGEKIQINQPIAEHTAGVQLIFKCLTEGKTAVLKSLNEIDAVAPLRFPRNKSQICQSACLRVPWSET